MSFKGCVFLERKTLQEPLSVQVELNRGVKEVVDFRTITYKQKQITIFLIIPTTHLFPLVGQSGSCVVNSMITFEKKYGIMKNYIKVYNPTCQY